jgi:hypothetical protein
MSPDLTGTTGQATGDPLSACRARVTELRSLLAVLFEDPPPPDIITVDDIRKRYQLTQFGPPALAAMEQTQRILRTRRDYGQVGLCEFHIGLIYLHYGDARAAANQFAVARQQWTLENDVAGIALSHYAQGVALRLAYHYEAAMGQYSRAERVLSRRVQDSVAARLARLLSPLRSLLDREQKSLRDLMWPQDGPQEAAGTTSGPGNGAGMADRGMDPDAGRREARSEGPTPTEGVAATSLPEATATAVEEIGHVGRPLWRLPPPAKIESAGPIPGHDLRDDRYRWYTVIRRADAYLAEFPEGTWLLVDTELGPGQRDGREMIVVASRRGDAGSVMVRPRPMTAGAVFYFLGYRMAASPGEAREPLILDDSGTAIRLPDALVLGIVVGSWHNILN